MRVAMSTLPGWGTDLSSCTTTSMPIFPGNHVMTDVHAHLARPHPAYHQNNIAKSLWLSQNQHIHAPTNWLEQDKACHTGSTNITQIAVHLHRLTAVHAVVKLADQAGFDLSTLCYAMQSETCPCQGSQRLLTASSVCYKSYDCLSRILVMHNTMQHRLWFRCQMQAA